MKGDCISWSSLTALLLIFAAVFTCLAVSKYAPYPELEDFLKREYSVTVLDRRGEVIAVLPLEEGLKREYASLEKIPLHVREVVVRSEDRWFFLHPGFDPAALVRSFLQYLAAGEVVSGGSTITMQTVRIISPKGKGLAGKLREIVLAFRLELNLSKEKILELYLNNLPFGFQVEGIASAARYFFGIPVELLSPEETVVLAVLPRSPGRYNPFTQKEAVLAGAARTGALLSPPVEKQSLLAVLNTAKPGVLPNRAPHFVRFLMDSQVSAGIPGTGPAPREISSSLDLVLNRQLEERIRFYLQKYRENRLYNGAGIVLDNRTGEILAYVGTHDFFDEDHAGQIDGVQVVNQPGSCLKPFLYALAIEKGFRPNTILPDQPMDFGGEEVYVPMNFDNRYHGPVRLRVALASSLNVPAAYTLMQLSVKRFTDFLISLGFESLEAQKQTVGIGLALGNAEVSLMELSRGFAVFPRSGKQLSVTGLKEENNGNEDEGRQLLSPYAAEIITHILSDRASRTLGFGQGEVFTTDYPAMFKTGTANQHQNIWALGATPWYTLGVWMGNHSGQTVVGKTGSSLPLLAVRDLLDSLQRSPVPFPLPSGADEVNICSQSGEAALPSCPATLTEFLPRGEQVPPCSIHSAAPAVVSKLRIRKPRDKAVFYLDPQAAPSHQSILIEAEGGVQGDTAAVFINGAYQDTVGYPFRYRFILRRGEWQVQFRTETASHQINFIVR